MRKIKAKTASAISNVSHLKARSPNLRCTRWPCGNAVVVAVSMSACINGVSVSNERTKSGRNCALRPAHALKLPGDGAKSVLNCFDALQHALFDVVGQGRVIQRRGHAFPLVYRPIQKLDELLALLGVLLLLIDQQPRAAGNGIGFF